MPVAAAARVAKLEPEEQREAVTESALTFYGAWRGLGLADASRFSTIRDSAA